MRFFFQICFALLAAAQLLLAAPIALTDVLDASAQDAGLEARSYKGKGTWYNPAENQGACGWYNHKSDIVVAISKKIWSKGHHCGKKVKVHAEGKTYTAKVVDECPGCSSGSLDMGPNFFKKFAKLDKGVIKISWTWA